MIIQVIGASPATTVFSRSKTSSNAEEGMFAIGGNFAKRTTYP